MKQTIYKKTSVFDMEVFFEYKFWFSLNMVKSFLNYTRKGTIN